MLGDKHLYNTLATFFEEIGSSDFSLVQIGAADGRDHVNELVLKYGKLNNWSCLFVEPGNLYFEMLKETYKDTNYLFERSAISNETGEATFHRPMPASLKEKIRLGLNPLKSKGKSDKKAFAKALKRGSLVASNYLLRATHKETGEKPAFYKSVVNCLSLKDLLLKNNLEKIDFLHIDAEGYDFEIIKQIDFSSRFRPLLICYEEWGGTSFKEGDDLSGTISLGPASSLECKKLLQKNKYLIHAVSSEDATKNIIAIDTTRLNFEF